MVDKEIFEVFVEEFREESELFANASSKEEALGHLRVIEGSSSLVGFERMRELASDTSKAIHRSGQLQPEQTAEFVTAARALLSEEALRQPAENPSQKSAWWKFW